MRRQNARFRKNAATRTTTSDRALLVYVCTCSDSDFGIERFGDAKGAYGGGHSLEVFLLRLRIHTRYDGMSVVSLALSLCHHNRSPPSGTAVVFALAGLSLERARDLFLVLFAEGSLATSGDDTGPSEHLAALEHGAAEERGTGACDVRSGPFRS